MFSLVKKFGNRTFLFNVACWQVIIQHYQIVFEILSLRRQQCGVRVVRFELYVQPGNEDVGSDERDDPRIKCQLLNLLRWIRPEGNVQLSKGYF